MDELDSWPLLAELLREVVVSNPDLSVRMADTIRTELEFYRAGSPVTPAEVERSTSEHITALVTPGLTVEEREAAPRDLGERRARKGIAQMDITDAIRTGTKYLWDAVVAHGRARGVSDAELVELASQVWFMHDAFVQAMSAGYRNEFAKSLLSRQQERLGILYGLLTARGQEAASPWNAVDRLGLPRTGGYVVVAVAAPHTGRMPLPRVEQALAQLQIISAWVMSGNVQLGIVSAVDPSWPAALESAAEQWTVTAGVSPLQQDYARVGLTVRLARIALAAAAPGTFSYFTDAPIPMAAAGSPELSGPIVEVVFGELLHLPETERQPLVDTLDAWFSTDGSFAAVATKLWVHQNTIRNRMHRIATLTGRDIAQPRHASELYLALSAYHQQAMGNLDDL
ncbi:PucR family transcriptional regulator [Diaminobutyricibacter sp. McL0618]|uniref:PucR family transcriptional regulator n=1 Tax=Leifsonia sp. McL0618 TaxID=3415677 RepID=UPI003CF8D684